MSFANDFVTHGQGEILLVLITHGHETAEQSQSRHRGNHLELDSHALLTERTADDLASSESRTSRALYMLV